MRRDNSEKKKKKWTGTERTDSPPSEKHKNIMALIARLAAIPTIVGLRGAKMDLLNITLIGFWVLWFIFDSVLTVKWKYPLVAKITKSIWVRGAVVLVVSLATIWFLTISYRKPPEQTNTQIIKTVKDVGKQTVEEIGAELRKQLLQAKVNDEERLAKDYPLGYVMIAFSGEKKIVLPYADRFECDWDKLTVHILMLGEKYIQVVIPHMRDKRVGLLFEDFGVGTAAIPGSKSPGIGVGKGLVIHVECLKAEPIGILAVLGFAGRDR